MPGMAQNFLLSFAFDGIGLHLVHCSVYNQASIVVSAWLCLLEDKHVTFLRYQFTRQYIYNVVFLSAKQQYMDFLFSNSLYMDVLQKNGPQQQNLCAWVLYPIQSQYKEYNIYATGVSPPTQLNNQIATILYAWWAWPTIEMAHLLLATEYPTDTGSGMNTV